MRLKQMRQLMRNHIINYTHGQLQEFPIEVKPSVLTARTPSIAEIIDNHARRCHSHFSTEQADTPTKPFSPVVDIPVPEMIGRVGTRVRAQAKVFAIEGQSFAVPTHDFEAIVPAQKPKVLSADKIRLRKPRCQSLLSQKLTVNPEQLRSCPTRHFCNLGPLRCMQHQFAAAIDSYRKFLPSPLSNSSVAD